ncbi:zinc-ribbon domain-containing protein, partial [Frankia sp. EI5c]|uniref:zinc-ribbon domain-containing protein n=1 Tax=Frankia sp. EI5c TaxID=683316 RepID=UPI0037C14491
MDLLRQEFVANLTRPELSIDELPPSSQDVCTWRCSSCGHEWPARFLYRSRRVKPTGCPECWRQRNRAPKPGESLADLNPELAAQFRHNLSRPGRGPTTLRTQSHDLCEWECDQGHRWPAIVANRTNGRGCSDCTGHGRSAF